MPTALLCAACALPVRCLCFYETRAEPGLRGYVSAVASGDVTRTLAPPTRCAVIRLRNTDTHVIHIPQAFVRTVQVGILKEFDPRGTKDTRRLKAAQSGGLWVLSQLCQRLQRRHPAMLTQCYSKCGCCSARPLASTEMHGCSFTSSLAFAISLRPCACWESQFQRSLAGRERFSAALQLRICPCLEACSKGHLWAC